MATTAVIDRDGRRLVRASRRVGEGEEFMAIVVPEAVHEGLCRVAGRRGTTVNELVTAALEHLAALG